MNIQLRFFGVRFIRKLAKWINYKVDFAPTTMMDKGEAKMVYLETLCRRTSYLPGDIVECGLGQGHSFARLAKVGFETKKKLWGFDSFAGFPAPAAEDISSYVVKAGDWGDVNLEMVTSKILALVPEVYLKESTVLTPGFFSDSLSKAPITQIAFLHLDGDLYQSYLDCFVALYDKVVPGGIIAFDECLSGIEYAKYPGAFTAISEFLHGKKVDLCRDLDTGKYYVVKR